MNDNQNQRPVTGSYHEVETLDELRTLLRKGGCIRRCSFQNIDFSVMQAEGLGLDAGITYEDCIFMGCVITREMKAQINKTDLIFSKMDVPYNSFRNTLYTAEALYDGYCVGNPETYEQSFDCKIYRHYINKGKTTTDIKETLARTLHDHSISCALHDLLALYDEKKVVGVMGGHGLLRTDATYKKIAQISKELTEKGYLMVSGGGPGAMEATHLGAWMAGRQNLELDEAVEMLAGAPCYKDVAWLDTAFQVRIKYPQSQFVSLGVPTWLYGHEPATPFATHIAKYFENAIREDGILTIAMGGIIYSPGSAGTMQEIFQDAVQNHYLSFGYASPMAFLDSHYWTEEIPVYPFLQQLVGTGKYKNMILSLSDEVDDVVAEILRFTQSS